MIRYKTIKQNILLVLDSTIHRLWCVAVVVKSLYIENLQQFQIYSKHQPEHFIPKPTISGILMHRVTIVMKIFVWCFYWLLMFSFNISSYVLACWTGQRHSDGKAEQLAGPVQRCHRHAGKCLVDDRGTAHPRLNHTSALSFTIKAQCGMNGQIKGKLS